MGAGTILRTAGVVALLAGMVADARADGVVMVVGKVSQRDRDAIIDAIQGAGSALSLRFAPASNRDAAEDSVACLRDKAPWSCVAPTIRGKDQLVIVEVDSDRGAGAPMTVVTAHLLTAAEDDSFATRNCAMCNEDALRQTVGDLSRDLLQRAAERSGRTRLAIRSRPDHAQIVLDGKLAGATDATLATYPGPHAVTIHAPGFAATTREVVAVDGATTDVAVELVPVAPVTQPSPPPGAPPREPGAKADSRSLLLPGVAIGVGAAAMVAGGVLIAFDQDPDPTGRQHYYYDTAKYGVVSLVAGAALAGTGVYLWLRPRSGAVATVAPLPGGGAAVGWAGRF